MCARISNALFLIAVSSLLLSGCEHLPWSDHHHDHDHDDHAHNDHPHKLDHDDDGIVFPREYQGKVGFRAEQVARRTLQPSIRANAMVKPSANGEARIIAPFDGQIIAPSEGIPEVGTRINAGDVIAYIVPFLHPDEVAQIQKNVRQAEIRLNRARSDHDRVSELVEAGALPARRRVESESELGVLRVELEQARRQLRQLEGTQSSTQKLSKVALRSPIDGVLVEQKIVHGMSIAAGVAISRVVNRQKLWLEARIPASDLHQIESPQGVWFSMNSVEASHDSETVALDLKENSRVVSTGEEVDPVTRTATMIFEMREPPLELRIGMFIQVHISYQQPQEALAIPVSSVIEEQGMDVVFVVKERELFERRVVELGLQDKGFVEVIEGLSEDEYVVSNGAYYIRLAAASTEDVGHGHAH